MAAIIQNGCLSVLFILFTLFHGDATANQTEDELTRALDSLRNGLAFLADDYKYVNLDTIIGTRMLEGQLAVLLRRLGPDSPINAGPVVAQRVRALKDLANAVSEAALPYIKLNYPTYYKKIGMIIQRGFWELDYPSRDFSKGLVVKPVSDGEPMKEEESDNCLAELFGTGLENGKCKISDKCWKLMTAKGYRHYSLSHEVFYLEIGQQSGCSKEMAQMVKKFGQTSVDSLREGFCANMLDEAKQISSKKFPDEWHDLFMEQGILCGMLGYRQFFNSDWLDSILSWQRGPGCFGRLDNYLSWVREVSRKRYFRSVDAVSHRRVKREEKALRNGCLAHRTTVALGAISQYLRYILEVIGQSHS